MNAVRLLLCAALCLGPACGQNHEDADRAELARAERDRLQKKREVDDLIDRRLRHDLGLPADADPSLPRPAGPVTTESRERLQQEWRDQEAQTSSLLEKYNKARALLEQLQTERAANATEGERDGQPVVVPQPGTAQPRQPSRPVDAAQPAADPAQPAGESRPPLSPPNLLTKLDRPRALIHGSTDHLRVAQALFKAGQRLADAADEARGIGRVDDARDYDKSAKERFERALDELQPLLQGREPPFAALFCQGRCRELLFRHAERYDGLSLARSAKDFQKQEQAVREPFLEIARRDVTKKGLRGEIEVLGAWGMAATAAVDHFRWINVNGSYQPRVDIGSITWPGEKDL